MTPQARDPRDLITRISPMQPAQQASEDPFEKLDKATLNKSGSESQLPAQPASSPWDAMMTKLGLRKEEEQRNPVSPTMPELPEGPPKWFLPLLGTLVTIWLILMYVYFSSPSR